MDWRGQGDEMGWLFTDLKDELKSWGHHGGERSHLILKSDGESAVVAV